MLIIMKTTGCLEKFMHNLIANNCHAGDFYFQQDGVPPLYRRAVGTYVDEHMSDRCIGQRDSVEYLSHSLDLMPLDVLWVPKRQNSAYKTGNSR